MTRDDFHEAIRADVRAHLAPFRRDNADFADEGRHLTKLVDEGCAMVDAYLAPKERRVAA